ncbi:MAG: ornithine carbamoyltransferase, partial [Hyphomicrobiaceae bacterium]
VGNNVAHSLALCGLKLGVDVRLCGPRSCWPNTERLDHLEQVARDRRTFLRLSDKPEELVPEADFVYTDVWLSMGEDKALWEQRIAALRPYRVDKELMALAGTYHAKFMHCLPAFHNADTTLGASIAKEFGIDCMEVTDDVFESEASIVFDQAENRMHMIKALLVATLGG